MSRERRHTPRVRIHGTIVADPRRSGHAVPVHDLSLNGFAIQSPEFFEPGTLCQCEFRPNHGPKTTLLAQVARADRAHDGPEFVIGFRFSMIEPDFRERVSRLVGTLGSATH